MAKYEEEQKRQRALKREVLKHLKTVGSSPYNGVYVHFDPNNTGDIGPVLTGLLRSEHIIRNEAQHITITDAGLRWLETPSA